MHFNFLFLCDQTTLFSHNGLFVQDVRGFVDFWLQVKSSGYWWQYFLRQMYYSTEFYLNLSQLWRLAVSLQINTFEVKSTIHTADLATFRRSTFVTAEMTAWAVSLDTITNVFAIWFQFWFSIVHCVDAKIVFLDVQRKKKDSF